MLFCLERQLATVERCQLRLHIAAVGFALQIVVVGTGRAICSSLLINSAIFSTFANPTLVRSAMSNDDKSRKTHTRIYFPKPYVL